MTAPPREEPTGPREGDRTRAGAGARVLCLLRFVAFAGVSVVARQLKPEAEGTGTHEQLGLPPCGLIEALGIPCLSCGWTTAWANMVRGNLGAAFMASPAGAILYVAGAVVALACLAQTVAGFPVLERVARWDWTRIGLGALVLVTASWIFKLVLVLSG